MRVMVVKSGSTGVQDLRAKLGRTDPNRTLDDIKVLNPHVDLNKIEPGTVLLLPDLADAPKNDSTSIQGQAFDDVRTLVADALEATGVRVRSGYDGLAERAKEVNAVLKTAPVKRAIESDPALAPQIEAAAAAFKQDAVQAKAADQTMKGLQKTIGEELDSLAKLLG